MNPNKASTTFVSSPLSEISYQPSEALRVDISDGRNIFKKSDVQDMKQYWFCASHMADGRKSSKEFQITRNNGQRFLLSQAIEFMEIQSSLIITTHCIQHNEMIIAVIATGVVALRKPAVRN